MTDGEKEEIHQQFRKAADMQADIIIQSIEQMDSRLPANMPKAQRNMAIKMMAEQAQKAVQLSMEQLADEMKRQQYNPEVLNGNNKVQ